MSRRSNYCLYFDANIYIAYYRQEVASYGHDRIQAISDTMEENRKGGTSIITSSITICEVLYVLLEQGLNQQGEDFKNLFKFGLHTPHDADPVISEKAARFRHYYVQHPVIRPPKPEPFKNLTSPDAIHLATAITYNADEFWTFDGLSTTSDKRKSVKLLWLNNKVANEPLLIVAPSLPNPVHSQPSLFANPQTPPAPAS